MNNKIILSAAALLMSVSSNAMADEKTGVQNHNLPQASVSNFGVEKKDKGLFNNINVPMSIGQESSVNAETLKFENLTKRENAHVEYLKSKAKTKVISDRIESGDFEGAARGVSNSNKDKGNEVLGGSFSPNSSMKPTLEFSGSDSPFSRSPVKKLKSKAISKAEAKKAYIKRNMPSVTDVSMIDGEVIIGVNQDGNNYAVSINEKLNAGYKIIKVDTLTATVLTPSGDKKRIYISDISDNSNDKSAGPSSPNSSNFSNSGLMVKSLGEGELGAAGFPMGTTFK